MLKADAAHNALSENAASQNLLIQGDNLEVLKHLKGAYRNQVKMIYIDPPYNTGSDGFVYDDDRNFTPAQLSHLAGISKDEAERVLDFTSRKSNSHSAWLTFMYPRLYIARDLLRNDGVIFISIDDNEQAQLKLLCDEVFGEESWIATIAWQNSSRQSDLIAIEHEYLLVYGKRPNANGEKWNKSRELSDKLNVLVSKCRLDGKTIKEAEEILSFEINCLIEEDKHKGTKANAWLVNYKNIDDQWSIYYAVDLTGEGQGPARKFGGKLIPPPEGRHWMGQDYINDLTADNRIVWRADRAYRKLFIHESLDNLKSIIRMPTRNGSELLKQLLGKDVFDKPKPHRLVTHLAHYVVNKNDLILDFFAGSGTTAHAVMQLNAEDGGNRQFICVQLDEATYPKSEARKAGYETIFEITRTRISKAAAKIRTEHPDYAGDLGYKMFQTVPIFDSYLDEADELTPNLELFNADKLTEQDRANLLLTWAVQDGIALTETLIPVDLAGYTAYKGGENGHLLYFIHPNVTLSVVIELLRRLDDEAGFSPKHLIVWGYIVESKALREMSEAVAQYTNRKSILLDLDVRF